MTMTRRGFVQRTGAAAVGKLVTGLLPDLGIAGPATAALLQSGCDSNRTIYRNWSRTLEFEVERYYAPTTENEVIKIVNEAREATKHVRTVGAGHSFSQLVVTPDTLVSLHKLNEVKTPPDVDPERVTVPAGMSLRNVIQMLKKNDPPLALKNLGSITPQSIAGAISTGTHGTGLTLGSLSTHVVGLRMIDGHGDVRTYTDKGSGDYLSAARISLGALGILTEVTLACEPLSQLRYNAYWCLLDEVLDKLDSLARDNVHMLFWWLLPPRPWTRQRHEVILFTKNPVGYSPKVLKDSMDLGNPEKLGRTLRGLAPNLTTLLPLLVPVVARWPGEGFHRFLTFTADYDEVLTLPMPEPPLPQLLHRECEYAIPADPADEANPWKGAVAALRSFQRVADESDLNLLMPVEVRFVAKDQVLLSPAYEQDVCYIGASALTGHAPVPQDNATEIFTRFEPIMRERGGKPHWGKIFSLTRDDVKKLYPATYQRFVDVRDELDPDRVFTNSMLDELFP
jgi:L-gulonolactone oxidase